MKTILTMMGVLFVWAFVALLATPSDSATFTKLNDTVVKLSGKIEKDDYKVLEKYLETNTKTTTMTMDSDGGAATEAFFIGNVIKDYNLNTIVPIGGRCLSACATAFLAGTEQKVLGVLGFHVTWLPKQDHSKFDVNQALQFGQWLGSLEALYFFDMGYRVQLAILITQVTSKDDFLILSKEDLDMFKVDNSDDYGRWDKLPKGWLANRIAGPRRLSYLLGGH